MVKFILNNSDLSEKQIEESLVLLDLIEKEVKSNNSLEVDMSELKWMLPCSALILSQKIFDLQFRKIKVSIIPPKNSALKSYLTTIGFPLGKKSNGKKYVPIHHFCRDDKNAENEIIEEEMKEILKCVKENLPDNMHNAISYLLSELSDNIDQHSKFTQGSIMVQYYEKKGFLDIGVFDNGLTIPKVYETNSFEISDDKDALDKALRGVSTKKGESGRGYGLSSSKRIVSEGLNGEFHLVSRNAMISVKNKEISQSKDLKLPLLGTLAYMRFEVPKKGLNIYGYLEGR